LFPVALQWHYRILQALALDEDLPEKPEDKTIPKYRQIDKVGYLSFSFFFYLCAFRDEALLTCPSVLESMSCRGPMN
jgi:ATP-dependent DNA helicase 2 subunit 1